MSDAFRSAMILSVGLLMGIFFTLNSVPAVGKEETLSEADVCLAKNIYHEARNQDTLGKIAVGLVTLNRVKDSRFPDTVCEVVFDSQMGINNQPKRHKCQFSWYCDGRSDRIHEQGAYEEIITLLSAIYFLSSNPVLDLTKGATHYHTYRVSPRWSAKLEKITQIDDHIFYR